MKGCKSCPAYAKCTVTYRESACAALRGTYGIDNDPEIITNADRTRAMSDGELANFLDTIHDFVEDGGGKIVDGNVIYPGNMLDWLEQPTEEDT